MSESQANRDPHNNGAKTVLCVDDEGPILNSLKRLLRREDYGLVTATGGREGLSILESRAVQLVISDQRMPEMTGVEFLQRVRELYPDTVRVVLSGYGDSGLIVDSINQGEIYRFLTKPWKDEELKRAIRQCLEHYDIVQQNRSLMEQIRRQNEELHRLNEGLEDVVKARTKMLQLSQEILEKLPVPVVGISREGWMVVANVIAKETFPSLRSITPGSDVRRVLPPSVADAVAGCLEGKKPDDSPPVEWEGKQVSVHVERLDGSDSPRGCILVLEVL